MTEAGISSFIKQYLILGLTFSAQMSLLIMMFRRDWSMMRQPWYWISTVILYPALIYYMLLKIFKDEV